MESAESDAESSTPSEEELRRQKVAAQFERYGLTPRSLATFCLSIVFWFVVSFLLLLLETLGIILGLFSSQPLPFLHPVSRFAYAVMAFWLVWPPLFLWVAGLFPHGRIATMVAAAKRDRPERFRRSAWKRTANLWNTLVQVSYLVVLALAPVILIERWPVWSLPPLATGLVNTAIFLGITALLGLIAWLPSWLVSPPDLRKITGRQQTTL